MTYSRYQRLKPEDFKRLSGVQHQTFTRMVAVLEEQVEQIKLKPDKPSKLSVADQVSRELREKSASIGRTSTSVSRGGCMKRQSAELSEK